MITIYKKDSKGKIRIIEIETKGNTVITRSGLINGQLVTNKKVTRAKNIGKTNETSPEQQAVLEAEAFIKNKLDKGYFTSLEEVESFKIILPMLAKDYKKEYKKIVNNNELYVQPKLDGMRCIVIAKKQNVTLISRGGKEILTVPHIIDTFKKININGIFDGELYSHGEGFQTNMKLIKKYRPGESERIKFHCYDICNEDLSFSSRFLDNNNCLLRTKIIDNNIIFVDTYKIQSEKDLIELHQGFIQNGYEGSIVRWGTEGYKFNSRSSHLLKYKDFLDRTAEIIDVIPTENRPSHGMLVCKFNEKEDGDNKNNVSLKNIFYATPKMTHKEREDLLKNKNKYIGLTAELRFFEYTDDGNPRFPVCVGFRLDK